MKLLDKVFRHNARLPETVSTYRAVFGLAPGIQGEAGRQVFFWLIERCGVFRRIDTEEQRVLHNWGIELFENMGLTQGINYKGVVDALLKLSIPAEALDEALSQKE